MFLQVLGTSVAAFEPSPTAEATRLSERYRTSPAANTPGMLVFTSTRMVTCASAELLTPQELQVARFVAAGANEQGSRLRLS